MQVKRSRFAAAVCGWILVAGVASADTKTWTGSVDGLWSDPGNWAGGVPAAGDRLSFFNAPGTRNTSNDLAASTIYDDISFLDSNYTVNGNAIGLTNGISGGGNFNTINLPIELQTSQTFQGNYLYLSGGVDLGSYTLTLNSGNVYISAPITGSGGLTINGGYPELSGTHTYSGPTYVDYGTLTLNGATLASAVTLRDFNTTLSGNGTLSSLTTAPTFSYAYLYPNGIINSGNVDLTNNTYLSVNLNGPTPGIDYGQLNVTGTVTLGTQIYLSIGLGYTPTVGQTYVLVNNDDVDAISGTFSGLPEGSSITLNASQFQISYVGGVDSNDIVLTCTVAAKTWTGTVNNLWSVAGNWGGLLPVPGDPLVFPSGASNLNNANDLTAGLIYDQLLLTGSNYTLNGNAIGLTNGISGGGNFNTINLPIELQTSQTFQGNYLYLSGGVDLGSYTLTLNSGNVYISAPITGSGGLTINGGYPELSGTHTYSGPTYVDYGTLTLNGATLASAVTLRDYNTALSGNGTLSSLTTAPTFSYAYLYPNGIINSGNVDLTNNTYLSVNLNGPTPGIDYGQLNVTGTVTLGTQIYLSIGLGYTPTVGQTYVLVNNDDVDAISGTFSGLPEGSSITLNASQFQISYVGGVDSNDIVLTCTVAAKTWTGTVNNLWSVAGNWGGLLPVPGDPLVFPSGASNLNNANDLTAGLIYDQLLLTGSNYTLNGNAIGLTNGISGGGNFNTINLPIELQTSQTFQGNYLYLSGGVDLGSYTLTLNSGNVYISAPITGSGGLTINGGYPELSGTHTYSGPTYVDYGTLTLNGATLASAVTLRDYNTALSGNGTLSSLTTAPTFSYAYLYPNGIINSGNVDLTNNTYLSVNLNGPTPGIDYGQLNVTGMVTLGTQIYLNFGLAFVPAQGQTFLIVNNDGIEPIGGTFSGLPEGSIINFGPYPFKLSYVGETGNDVTLTSLSGDPLNTAPVAVDDAYNAYADTPLNVGAPGVLSLDFDIDMDMLSVILAGPTTAQGGTVAVNPDGSFLYTPPASYIGPDSFTYVISDGNNGTDIATVSITVLAVPTPTPTQTPTQSPLPSIPPTASATPTLTPSSVCGDGVLQTGEECDDGNVASGDICPSTPADNCRYSSSGELIRGNRRTASRNARGCQLEWYVVNPNQPLDRRGLPSNRQVCQDQDPTCDFDPAPGRCRFKVVTCLNTSDVNLPACMPYGISTLRVYRPNPNSGRLPGWQAALSANRSTLDGALQQLLDPQSPGLAYTNQIPLPAAEQNQCSAAFDVDIPLLGARKRTASLMVRTRDDSPPRRKYAATSSLRLICKQ